MCIDAAVDESRLSRLATERTSILAADAPRIPCRMRRSSWIVAKFVRACTALRKFRDRSAGATQATVGILYSSTISRIATIAYCRPLIKRRKGGAACPRAHAGIAESSMSSVRFLYTFSPDVFPMKYQLLESPWLFRYGTKYAWSQLQKHRLSRSSSEPGRAATMPEGRREWS